MLASSGGGEAKTKIAFVKTSCLVCRYQKHAAICGKTPKTQRPCFVRVHQRGRERRHTGGLRNAE